jgi:flagellar hook-associated protein 2
MFSIDGLISGLNTESIIEGLISIQNRKVDGFKSRKAGVLVKQQSLQGVEARLLSFRAKLAQLNRSTNSLFESRQVQSSHPELVTSTASNQAVEGSYSIRVMSLAAAHQIGSNGFSSSTDAITTGNLRLQVGDRPPATITVDGSNNSVAGLVQAINAQSQDVSATIIRDQASGTDRILLTSKHTGSDNSISIVNNLATVPGVARPDFSGTPIQSASNAVVQFGSGAGAIVTEFATNRVETLIQGVTLDLKSANVSQDITISVSRNTESAQNAIKEFVEEYNSLVTFINDQTRFNPETQLASPLLGNRSVSELKNRLAAMVTETVQGLGTNLNRLSQVGLTIDATGKLNLDNAKLGKALAGELPGIAANDVARLFGLTGTSNNVGIEFFSGSTRTLASAAPIQVDILQAAEHGSLLATNKWVAETVDIGSTNNQFQITIDGVQSEVLTLADGTYTQAEMAQHLQSVINASYQLGNREVAVTVDGDKLRITSQSYGSSSTVSSISGSSTTDLGFNGTENGVGKDVAGTFIVNGVVETAVGSGRLLVGNSDNANTADLQVRVTLSPTQVSAGVDGSLTIARGATSRLDEMLGDFLDTEKGTLGTLNRAFDLQKESIDKSIEGINKLTESKRTYLLKQFAALERSLSSLQATASIVTSQLGSIQTSRN